MADKLRLYVLCPCCGGTGLVNWGTAPDQPGTVTCPRCADETPPFGAKVIDGLRHVYEGRFEEVEDE